MGKTFKVALALVGLTVGAGFASGQEVIQYFLAFGYWGILGAAVAGAAQAGADAAERGGSGGGGAGERTLPDRAGGRP